MPSVTSWLTAKLSLGRLRPPVGWGAVLGTGTLLGIGFTVSILVASIVLRGEQLQQAKLGVLTTVVLGCASSWILFRVVKLLPARSGPAGCLAPRPRSPTSPTPSTRLATMSAARGKLRSRWSSTATSNAPTAGRPNRSIRTLLAELGDLRYVWRHLPLDDVHPRAQLAAEAAEAASSQGAFWAMHDLLFDHQDQLRPTDLVRYAEQLGLDLERFQRDLDQGTGADRVAQDREGAELSGVGGTPSFFINGMHHRGAYDLQTLTQAVKVARIRAGLGVAAPADA